MKLARKFLVALTLLVWALLVGDLTLQLFLEQERTDSDMRSDHLLLGRSLAGSFQRAWQLAGEREALGLLALSNEFQHQVAVRWVWLDAEGQGPFAPRLDALALRSVASGSEHSFELGEGEKAALVTYVPAEARGRRGAIELTELHTVKNHLFRQTILIAALSTVAIGVVFLASAFWLGRRLIGRPLKLLGEHAGKVASGDLSARVVLNQQDELGGLASTLNEMTVALAQGREALHTENTARIAALESVRHADRLTTVGKLASGVAHELGTPLNVVYCRGKMIASGEEKGETAAASGLIIAEQAQVMTRILRQLLDFARRTEPKRTRENIRAISERTVALLEPLASKKSTTLVTETAPSIEVDCDAGQLQQVLTNLIMNAIQATDRAGGMVRLSAENVRQNPPTTIGGKETDYVRIDVQDSGHGIQPEVLPHVFEPFFTTKEVGEGTGLGLSVSYGMVRDHGGWISVESTPGKGSRFSVFLPRSAE